MDTFFLHTYKQALLVNSFAIHLQAAHVDAETHTHTSEILAQTHSRTRKGPATRTECCLS